MGKKAPEASFPSGGHGAFSVGFPELRGVSNPNPPHSPSNRTHPQVAPRPQTSASNDNQLQTLTTASTQDPRRLRV